jgi:hypothetical protein
LVPRQIFQSDSRLILAMQIKSFESPIGDANKSLQRSTINRLQLISNKLIEEGCQLRGRLPWRELSGGQSDGDGVNLYGDILLHKASAQYLLQ